MEENIEKLKFPIGKYKAVLEFNFSRTVEDIKTLESFSKKLKTEFPLSTKQSFHLFRSML